MYLASCIRFQLFKWYYDELSFIQTHLWIDSTTDVCYMEACDWFETYGVISGEKKLLWTLIFLIHYQTKLCLAHDLKCKPGTLMKWIWITIDILSKMKIVSITQVCIILNDDQYLLVNIE